MELYAESTLAAKEVEGHRWISAYPDRADSRSCGTTKPKALEGMGFPEANKTWKLLITVLTVLLLSGEGDIRTVKAWPNG